MPLQHLDLRHHLAGAVLRELAREPRHELVRGHGVQFDAAALADQKVDLLLAEAVLAQLVLARPFLGRGLVQRAHQLVDQRLQGAAAALLRGQIQAPVASFSVDPEQGCKQWRRLLRGVDAAGQQHLELVETGLWRLASGEAGSVSQLLNHRPQRAVDVIGRALARISHRRHLWANVWSSSSCGRRVFLILRRPDWLPGMIVGCRPRAASQRDMSIMRCVRVVFSAPLRRAPGGRSPSPAARGGRRPWRS